MNLYSAWRWLYIAETCIWLSPTDKVVFRLDLRYFNSQVFSNNLHDMPKNKKKK